MSFLLQFMVSDEQCFKVGLSNCLVFIFMILVYITSVIPSMCSIVLCNGEGPRQSPNLVENGFCLWRMDSVSAKASTESILQKQNPFSTRFGLCLGPSPLHILIDHARLSWPELIWSDPTPVLSNRKYFTIMYKWIDPEPC